MKKNQDLFREKNQDFSRSQNLFLIQSHSMSKSGIIAIIW